jgi:hypothetical protein
MTIIIGGMLVSSAFGQASSPSLADTLQFLEGAGQNPPSATGNAAGEGIDLYDGEATADQWTPAKGCSVQIQQDMPDGSGTNAKLSLADIDPSSFQLEDAKEADGRVILELSFHTTNYTDKIEFTSCDGKSLCDHKLILRSNDWFIEFERVGSYKDFAQRYGKALRHAVELCGGKRSAF